MKLRNLIIILSILLLSGVFSGCKKESKNIFNMFAVALTFHSSSTHALPADGSIEISATDSVLLDYTIESPDADMYMVCLYKTGTTTPMTRIPIPDGANRRTFSGKFTFYGSNLGAGTSTYRIWALDKEGVYLGDGYKNVVIDVISNLKYFPNRRMELPDTINKVHNSFMSLNDGKLYSYTTGAAHSGTIDLGIFNKYDTVRNASGVITSIPLNHYIYSISANPSPFRIYDFSSWTKRTTLFSAPVAGTAQNFRTMFNTSAKIETEAKKRAVNLTVTPAIPVNQFVYFLTPEGRYGVIFVQSMQIEFAGSQEASSKRIMVVSHRIQE